MSGVLDEVRRECKIRGGRENTWRRSSIEEYFAGAKSWQILVKSSKVAFVFKWKRIGRGTELSSEFRSKNLDSQRYF